MAAGGSYDPTAANIRSSFDSLMKSFPEVREVFFDEFKMYPTLYTNFLDTYNSKKKTETFNTVGGRGIWSSKTESNEYTFADYAQGTEVTITPTTFADAYDVSEELDEDNQKSGIMDNAREMARGGYAACENASAAILNNAFTGGTTGSDGGQLCISTHNLINSASTGDNAETAALNAAGLNALYILADKIVNEANIYVPVEYSTLVVPPELRTQAEELANSAKTPHSGNNVDNVYKNRIKKIVVDPYLTSSTAFYLAAPGLKKKGLIVWRIKPQFTPDRDPFSGNFLYKARERLGVTHVDWQGMVASTGAV